MQSDVDTGDIVLYRDSSKGYVPAIVVKVHEHSADPEFPVLALVVFVTGFHLGCYPLDAVKHGRDAGEWIYRGELRTRLGPAPTAADLYIEKEKAAGRWKDEDDDTPPQDPPEDPPTDGDEATAKESENPDSEPS